MMFAVCDAVGGDEHSRQQADWGPDVLSSPNCYRQMAATLATRNRPHKHAKRSHRSRVQNYK